MHLARVTNRLCLLGGVLALLLASTPSHAALTLTDYAANTRHFTMSTFASGFPVGGVGAGPFGVAYRADGAVLVDHYNGSIYIFPNHDDNQVAGATLTTNYGTGPSLRGFVQIYSNGVYHYYIARQTANDVIEVSPTTGVLIRTVATVSQPIGLVGYPPPPLGPVSTHSGHLFASTAGGTIVEIDPTVAAPGNTTTFANLGAVGDGIAFSPDGSILYVAKPSTNNILGYSVPPSGAGTLAYTSPAVGSGIDGIAIGLGTLVGYLYTDHNDGTMWEIGLPGGPTPGSLNKIADGGSRGDFIAIDPSVYSGGPSGFPSLLVTQSDRIMRLDPPGGGWFGPPTSSTTLQPAVVPAITTIGAIAVMLLLLGAGAVIAMRRRSA